MRHLFRYIAPIILFISIFIIYKQTEKVNIPNTEPIQTELAEATVNSKMNEAFDRGFYSEFNTSFKKSCVASALNAIP